MFYTPAAVAHYIAESVLRHDPVARALPSAAAGAEANPRSGLRRRGILSAVQCTTRPRNFLRPEKRRPIAMGVLWEAAETSRMKWPSNFTASTSTRKRC